MAINSKAKGSAFELDICKQLSLWWTDGASNAVFHRSVTSGGFATTRGKSGLKSENAHGDIMALDPSGQPMLRAFCFELKRGYKPDALDLIDRLPSHRSPTILATFWTQATTSAEGANSLFPAVVYKRDQKQASIILPSQFFTEIAPFLGPIRGNRLTATINGEDVVFMLWSDFLFYVTPEAIKELVK